MKIATIVGARPQFIKVSPVSKEIKNHSGLDEFLIHTGQHYDKSMSEIFFSQLSIEPPKYNLNISGTTHGDMTGRMIAAIESVLIEEKPDLVLVYGDTNSTLAASISASKLMIPIAHVEAGLRSLNMRMPEEINRILTDRVSEILFTPSRSADDNLLKEGISKHKIVRSGDVMLDALLQYLPLFRSKKGGETGLNLKSYALVTIHRQENSNNPENWNEIVKLLNAVSEIIPLVWPVHPRVAQMVPDSINDNSNIKLIDPLGYFEMINTVRNAKFVITDSGGLQKEAFFMEVPCITLRDETEWTELVDIGWNLLLPPSQLHSGSARLIVDFSPSNDFVPEVYGDGNASKIIVDKIINL